MYTSNSQLEDTEGQSSVKNSAGVLQPVWKIKQQRKKLRKQIFGDHYNYNYRRPNQNNLYRVQENRNTEIERENRILLEKIQAIFKKNNSRRNQFSNSQAHIQASEEEEDHHREIEKDRRKSNRSQSYNTNLIKLQRLHRYSNQSENKNKSTKKLEEETPQKECHTTKKPNTSQYLKTQTHANLISKRTQRNKTMAAKNMKTITEADQTDRFNACHHQSQHTTDLKFSELQPRKLPPTPKIMLFNGHKHVSSILFGFQIYIQTQQYTIKAEPITKGNQAYTQEIITLPYTEYRKIYTKYLEGDHGNIFEYLWVSKLSGLLQFVGLSKKFMQQVTYKTKQIKKTDKIEQKKKQVQIEQKKQEKKIKQKVVQQRTIEQKRIEEERAESKREVIEEIVDKQNSILQESQMGMEEDGKKEGDGNQKEQSKQENVDNFFKEQDQKKETPKKKTIEEEYKEQFEDVYLPLS